MSDSGRATKAAARIEATAAAKATKATTEAEATTEPAKERAEAAAIRNRNRGRGHVMPPVGALGEGARGEQRQAHHQAEHQSCGKFAHVVH